MVILRDLHNQSVEVALAVAGRTVKVVGMARFESHSALGPILRIAVADPLGNFELLIKEAEWQGEVIPPNHRSGSYLIDLVNAAAATGGVRLLVSG